jgi:hypothetical protein
MWRSCDLMYRVYEDEISRECSTHGVKCVQSFVGYPEQDVDWNIILQLILKMGVCGLVSCGSG